MLMKPLSCDESAATTKEFGFIGVAQEILETIVDGFCAIDKEWRIVYVNLPACEMWGSTPEALIGRVFWEVFPQLTGTDFEKLLRAAAGALRRVEYETFSPIIKGWLWVRVCPMSGGLTGLYCRNISEQKSAEGALRESDERFRRVFDQSPLGMATADLDGRFREVNPALSHMLGYGVEDLTRLSYLDIVHPDDLEECARQGRAAAAGEIPHFQLEERFVRKTGEPIWVRINVSPMRGRDGRVLYTLGIIESIDDRRRAEEALQQANELLEQRIEERTRQLSASQARLQAHFNNSPDWLMLFRATPDGAFIYEDLNPATERGYGLKRDQVLGRRVEEVLGVEPAQLPLRHMRACVRTGENQRCIARRTMAGVTRTIDVLFVLVPEWHEEAKFIIATARDITEMRQIEDQLHQAQKLEALGQLTGGVAHDFNNLLTVLQGCLEMLSGRQQSDQLQARVDTALRTVERGERLTGQLLAFARRQPLARATIDLNAQLRRMTELLVRTVGSGIAIHTDLAPDLWLVDADATQLELAVINLAINAGDAMPGGGELGIRTFNQAASARECALEQPTKVGDFVGLEISDTGHGMPPEAVARAFEPFFTTKDAGKGTGLGLSMVYGFARQSGGSASIRSEIGRGTAVTLLLPRGFPARETGAASTDLPQGGST
jgi:PAS domain S-box-containing protein